MLPRVPPPVRDARRRCAMQGSVPDARRRCPMPAAGGVRSPWRGHSQSMSGKQIEGDNERRRTLARRARDEGHRPSAEGVTLGASKQPEHVRHGERDGPPLAGARKLDAETTRPPTRPRAADRPRRPRPAQPRPEIEDTRYRDLVADIGQRLGLDFDSARVAAEATITALARALPEADRTRLIEAVPAELHDDRPVTSPTPSRDATELLAEVARTAHITLEQARYRAQATLGALAERDRRLVDSLTLPAGTDTLLAAPPVGGGLVDPAGHPAPLTDDELRSALADLPYWSGDRQALSRTMVRNPGVIELVLDRLERLREEYGRGPGIARPAADTAVLTVRTHRVKAVTVLDVDLAHRIDEAIIEIEE